MTSQYYAVEVWTFNVHTGGRWCIVGTRHTMREALTWARDTKRSSGEPTRVVKQVRTIVAEWR